MDFKNLKVEEFTTPNPEFVETHTKLPQIWELMVEKGIRHLLVRNTKGDVVGIISERDLIAFSQSVNFQEIEAVEIMSGDLVTLSPQTPMFEVALKMSQKKVGSIITEDPIDKSLGIFTSTDALNALVEVLRGDFDKTI